MIKKLQLRGISRTPSDRMTSDGGCAESLNVQLHAGEIAPMPKPEMMNDPAGNKISVDGDILFIHKGIGYEHLISREGQSLTFVSTIGEVASGSLNVTLDTDESINDLTAIGNTIILSTSKDMYYVLWKEGEYHFLGHQIPVPNIHFRIGGLDSERNDMDDFGLPNRSDFPDFFESNGRFKFWYPNTQDGIFSMYILPLLDQFFYEANDGSVPVSDFDLNPNSFGTKSVKYQTSNDRQQEWLDKIWGMIDEKIAEEARRGRCYFPVFVRYAVRLYDGTAYSESIPVLLGADLRSYLKVRTVMASIAVPRLTTIKIGGVSYSSGSHVLITPNDDNERDLFTGSGEKYREFDRMMKMKMNLPKPFSVFAKPMDGSGIFDGWEDIVRGIDIFVSSPLMPIMRNAMKITQVPGFYAENDSDSGEFMGIYDISLDPYYMEENQEQLVLQHQQTFLAKSFSLEDFKALTGDVVLDDINFSSDYIMTQEAMKETPWSMHHTVGEHMFTYNKRLMLTDVKQSLYHGYPFYHSAKWIRATENPVRLRFVYYLRGEGGEAVVVCRDHVGNMEITPQKAEVTGHFQQYYEEKAVAWLAYPDSRCYRMEVYAISPGGGVSYASYQMKPMSGIDVAYAFLGFGTEISPATASVREVSENALFVLPNQLFVSKTNNPFVFPADETVTFTAGRIMNLAAVTIPLSEGQAGQFDLYVFTDEGIYALSPDSEGSLRTSHCVSRDILISKDAVAGIEQGVFFAAARGLLLLRGSTVTKVSDAIEGPTITMDSDLMASISEKHFGGMVLEPQQPFHEFLAGCRIAYDYASTRIILMNEAHRTMYVYKFDTQTWHRMDMGLGYPVRTLNSFPEAFIVTRAQGEDGTQAVYNFSVVLESAHAEVAPGLIITRPFDLGEPDVRKAVRDLRVRGNCHRHDVAYILFGSFDGIRWVRLRSLHGGSFKQFRMMILTGLSPTERISWVDVDYDTRFTNKLR